MLRNLLLIHEVLLEDELRACVHELGGIVTVCCYSPDTYEFALRAGMSVIALDDGCDIAELKSCMNVSLRIIQRLNDSIFDYLKHKFTGVISPSFLNSIHYNYFLNVALNTFVVPYSQIYGILSNHSYTTFTEIRGIEEDFLFEEIFSSTLRARPAESFKLACENLGVIYRCINRHWNPVVPAKSSLKSIVTNNIVKIAGKIIDTVEYLRFKAISNPFDSKVVVNANGYDFPFVSSKIFADLGYNKVSLAQLCFGEKKYHPDRKRVENITEELKLHVLSKMDDMVLPSNISHKLIRFVLLLFVDYFVKQLDMFLFAIQKKSFNFSKATIICPPVVDLKDIYYVRALCYRGAKIIGWQHGGNYGYMELPIFLLHDIVNCDMFLGYGKSVSDYAKNNDHSVLDKEYINFAKVLTVGSYRIPIDSKYKRIRAEALTKLQVLYVCRDYQVSHINLANGFVITPMLYYEIQKRIISALLTITNLDVTLRQHPGNRVGNIEALSSWIEMEDKGDITVSGRCKFSDSIENVDLVIFDFPSTTFLEVLSSKIPVVVYQEQDTYKLFNAYFKEIDSLVTVVTNIDELVLTVEKFKKGFSNSLSDSLDVGDFIIDAKRQNSAELQLWKSVLS